MTRKDNKSSSVRPAGISWLGSATISLAASVFFIVSTAQGQISGLEFSGDFRLRYENTNNQQSGPIRDSRSREVVRFRGSLGKQINDMLTFGARIATGSADDPNTADVTLGNFVNDLDVSLDKLFLELRHERLFVTGGKFGNPFLKTDLVWDGDVNPQGLAASYSFSGNGQASTKLTGLYSIVDEHSNTSTPDSYMWGAQFSLSTKPSPDFGITLAGAYYDYDITSLSNADAGDTRSNYLAANGTEYVSDFNLVNAIAIAELKGFNPNFPIRIVADYVKNTGAEVDEDQGFSVDFFVGKASAKKDVRFRYGYSETETDAVLAAFSNDNTTIATNYVQHTITAEYVALDNTTLDLTFYLHRNKLATNPSIDTGEYVARLRLNAVVKF